MRGSFTVEMAILFPLVFLILMALMQLGLYFSYRIYAKAALQQSLLICTDQREQGREPESAAALAEQHLAERLEQLPVRVEAAEVTAQAGWLKEEYIAGIRAESFFLIPLSWQEQQTREWRNPVLFRNRVDFIWEKGKAFVDRKGGTD